MNLYAHHLLSPPIFADEEQTRVARILYTVLFAFLSAAAFITFLGIWNTDFTLAGALGATSLVLVAALWLTRCGYLATASNMILLTLLIMAGYLLSVGNGIHDNLIIIYPGILILGSLVLNKRGFLVLVTLSILSVGGIVLGEMQGLIQTRYSADTSLEDFFSVGTGLLITAVAVRLLANDLLQNLTQARAAQRALSQSHAELQAYTHELEQKRFTQERYTTQLRTAAEVAQQLTLILDPDELLNQIVTLLQDRFHLYHIQVYLLDETTNHLVIQAASGEVGRLLHQRGHYIPLKRPDSLVARAAREHAVLVVNDVKQEPSFLPNPLLPNTCAEVTVPLLVKDHTLGVLDIQEDEPDAFQESDLNTFHILAGQIAVALENARLFSKLIQSEAALREGESRYRSLFEDSPISLWETDFSGVKQALAEIRLSGGQSWRSYLSEHPEMIAPCLQQAKVLDVNQMTLTMFHAADKQTLFAAFSNFLAPEIADFLREQLIALANDLVSFTGEAILRKLNGEKIYTLYRLVIAPGYEDTWKKAFISLIDITERKKVEQALQVERDFARQVLENMGQGLTVTNADSRFEFVNPAYTRMMGYSAETLLNMSPFDLTTPADKERLTQSWEKRKGGQSSSYEIQLVHADGHLVDVMVSGVPRQEGGKITGSIAVITDLTERKQAEHEREQLITELEARNAELGRFTYTVSHDLKSPLVTIKGFLGMLEKDIAKEDTPRIKSDIERIRTAAGTMETLLNDLLELSRVGRLENPPQEMSFTRLAHEAVERVMGQIVEREVEVDIAPDLPGIYGDIPRLVELLQNLVDNAVKFMGKQPSPRIEIGMKSLDSETVFYVSDNGVGIAPRYHEKIFGLFERLNPAIEGTGLGLALVKRIVEVHNGRIWVESDGSGNGTTFYFTLPGKPPAALESAAKYVGQNFKGLGDI